MAVLVLAAAPVFLILETDDKNEIAGSGITPVTEEVMTALEEPGQLPPIVYAANTEGEFLIFATDEMGSPPVGVLEEEATDPVWSPDGQEVLFVGEVAGQLQKRQGLLAIRRDKAVELVKKGPQIPSRISFRGSTDEVAVQSTLPTTGVSTGISYQSSIDSVNVRTGSQKTLFEANGSAYSPAWSPDGTRLIVVAGDAGCRSEKRADPSVSKSPDSIRSYQRMFRPERRIYSIDGRPLSSCRIPGSCSSALPCGGASAPASLHLWLPRFRQIE